MTQNNDDLIAKLTATLQKHMSTVEPKVMEVIEKMSALGANTDAETVNILVDYLIQSENDLLRSAAASRLSEIGTEDVLQRLTTLLNTTDDTQIQALIVQIFGDVGDSQATPLLLAIFQSTTDIDMRQRTALALGKCGGDGAYDVLMTALDRPYTEDDLGLLQTIISGLGWLGDDRAVPDLVRVMQTHRDKETQTFAAEALGRLGSQRCFAPLRDTLLDKNRQAIVRYYAAHALGLLGDTRAVDTLVQVINDPNEHSWVAQKASESHAMLSPDVGATPSETG